MNFLQSKNVSLLCAGLNGVFAVGAFSQQNWPMLAICLVFGGICLNNYRNA